MFLTVYILIFRRCFVFFSCFNSNTNQKGYQLHSHQHEKEYHQIPSFDMNDITFDPTECIKAYHIMQVVHLKNVLKGTTTTKGSIKDANEEEEEVSSDRKTRWTDIGQIYDELNADDKASWCVETTGNNNSNNNPTTSNTTTTITTTPQFLKNESKHVTKRAYCSFLIQKDKDMYHTMLKDLPFVHFKWNETLDWKYEDAIWIFFGRNPIGNINLNGRCDHTDSVSHDGTWHYQLSGKKRWFIRPTDELIKHIISSSSSSKDDMSSTINEKTVYQIDCNENDILLINTRLWFHRTIIPPQRVPSVSYARDFYLGITEDYNNKTDRIVGTSDSCMLNVDGLYATKFISANTIILSEHDMPDCQLPTSKTPNCKVAAVCDDDDDNNSDNDPYNVIVSTRDIQSGEFFCIGEDSTDDDDSDDNDGIDGSHSKNKEEEEDDDEGDEEIGLDSGNISSDDDTK